MSFEMAACCHLEFWDIWDWVICITMPSVLWRCWLGGRKGIRPVKNWVVRCSHGYPSGAMCTLSMAQLMPLPLTVSCFSKIQIGKLPPSLILEFSIFNGQWVRTKMQWWWTGEETVLHEHAKFSQDQSLRWRDILICNFQDVGSHVLNFQKFEILMISPLYGHDTYGPAKFHQNQSKA